MTSILVILQHLLLYGAWYGWDGGHTWGPRFLVPALPFLVLSTGPLLDRWLKEGVVPRLTVGTLLAFSLVIQASGFLVDFNRIPQPERPNDPLLWELPNRSWLGLFELLVGGQLDAVWARRGLWLVPVALGAAVALTLVTRLRISKHSLLADFLALGLTLIGLGCQVAVADSAGPRELELAAAVAQLQRLAQPHDAVVIVAPFGQSGFLSPYRLANPVLGLSQDSLRLEPRFRLSLARLLQPRSSIWLLVEGFQFPEPAAELDAELHRQLCWTGPVNYFGVARLTRFLVPGTFQDLGVGATFGGWLRLKSSAWDGGELLAPGDGFCVRLIWEGTITGSPRKAHVSVQVLDAAGRLVAQHDGPPGAGFYQPGPTIVDNHGLLLPGGLADGTFHLTVVVYDPATLERYPLENGTDRLTLAIFRVKSPGK